MPLDPVEHPDGNVAVRDPSGRGIGLVARVLGKEELHDVTLEYLVKPHFASCPARKPPPPPTPPPANVLDLNEARRKRGATQ